MANDQMVKHLPPNTHRNTWQTSAFDGIKLAHRNALKLIRFLSASFALAKATRRKEKARRASEEDPSAPLSAASAATQTIGDLLYAEFEVSLNR